MKSAHDEALMRRAIALSRRGFPAPNPHVGCVIARGEQVIGEGWHEFAGGLHAEAMALKNASEDPRGAACYVTLEPCSSHGRQPPCSQALIKAGVSRVVFACEDPNPAKAGGGEVLRAAGIEVEAGLLAREAAEANRVFLEFHRLSRPYVAVKAAITLDGFIARPDGASKWITGEAARRAGHWLRAEMGCVLVGRETVFCDDPALTARIDGVVNQPIRAVLDPCARLTGDERIFEGAGALWFVGESQARLGAIPLPLSNGAFAAGQILGELGRRGISGVLVEGGGRTIRTFLEAGFVDEIHLFQAPILFGTGRPWAGGLTSMPAGFRLESTESLGEDAHLIYRRTV